MEDWKEKLKKYKNRHIESSNTSKNQFRQNEVLTIIEDVNAELSESTKALPITSGYIFKEFISYESAEEIINSVQNLLKTSNNDIDSAKYSTVVLCKSLIENGENPFEMLIYGAKGRELEKGKENILIDILKELNNYDKNNFMYKAFGNILTNWNWVNLLSITVKACMYLNMKELGRNLVQLFEKNVHLRKKAAEAIIYLKLEKYYERIINMLLAIKADSKEITGILLGIFKKMARSSIEGANIVLNSYIENTNRALDNIFISALKGSINAKNLDLIMKYTDNENKTLQKKSLYLLGKMQNEYATEKLLSLEKKKGVDKNIFTIAVGYAKDPKTAEALKRQAEDSKNSVELRTSALISLSNLNDERFIPYIEGYIDKSIEFEIASCSGLIQLGKMDKLPKIFKYVISNEFDEKYIKMALRELQRLRGLKIEKVNANLNIAAKKILEKENEFMINNVLSILMRAVDFETVEILLEKILSTKFENVKLKILDYLARNFFMINFSIRDKVRDAIVECSRGNSKKVSEKALNCLRIINRTNDSTPVFERQD